MVRRTPSKEEDHDGELVVDEEGKATPPQPLGAPPETSGSDRGSRGAIGGRLRALGRRAKGTTQRIAARVQESSPKARTVLKSTAEHARKLGEKAGDSAQQALARARDKKPAAEAALKNATKQARDIGRRARGSTQRTITRAREKSPEIRAALGKATEHARDVGRSVRDSTARAVARTREARPTARTPELRAAEETSPVDQRPEASTEPEASSVSELRPPGSGAQDQPEPAGESLSTLREEHTVSGGSFVEPRGDSLSFKEPVSPPAALSAQQLLDLHHLKLLSYFHYATSAFLVVAILVAMSGGWLFLLSFGLGEAFSAGSFGSFLGGCFWKSVYYPVMPILLLVAGRSLARQRRYLFCCVSAFLACLWIPLGTVLGVATLIVLLRRTVRPLFLPTEGDARRRVLEP